MRRVCLLASLLAAAGHLCATPVLNCALLGLATGVIIPGGATDGSTGCWTGTTTGGVGFINTTVWDSLNWGSATEPSGPSGLGDATVGNNSFATTPGSPVATRTATTFSDQVSVQLAPTYTGSATAVLRVDDFKYEYSQISHTWVLPNAPGSGTPNLANFAGHFNSASGTPPPGAPSGDHLLELASGGPLELTFSNTVSGVWFEIAALGITNNTLFFAEVQAFDAGGHSLGTYALLETANGTGGLCSTLGGRTPTPCNDAPYVGFYDPEGRIKSIYITTYSGTSTGYATGTPVGSPLGFAIDTLELDPIPEPVAPLMIGGGLAAIALYSRKRRSRVG